MSTTQEEIYAMQRAGHFLSKIVSREIKRIPKVIRDEAYSVLRHYPGRTGIEINWKRGKNRLQSLEKDSTDKIAA